MALDGAVDDPNQYFQGGTDGGPPIFDEAMEANEAAVIGAEDVVLLGRRMYDEWADFWPTVPDEQFATFINNVKKYVITSSPLEREWTNAEAVHRPVAEFVRELKTKPGGDIGVHGSIQLAHSLLAEGLVDELRLVIGAAVGFGGRRLFEGLDVRRLELLSAKPTPSGSLLLAYRVV